jgi:predicted transcriptional regulator
MQGWTDLDDVFFFPKSRFTDEYGPLQTTGGDALAQWMCERQPAIVAIDTLSRVCGGDQNDVAKMTAALDPLQQLAQDHKCAVLLVDHHKKGLLEQPDSVGDILGSVGKGAIADNSIGLYRERGKASAQLVLVGRDMPDASHALHFDGVTGLWTLTGEGDRFMDSDYDKALLAAVEMYEPARLSEIAKEVDRNRSNVYARLQDLANFGRIHREGSGREARYTVVKELL